ncbi:hypothetical protein [Diaminobutyricimonas sp. LJ205]|uniref:hypothetical protein n=1 Tax=Diaminobutyricimonas sp. LJ205 TaxID=2683590 RepID=UPI0012F48D3E|nr:hypothetical protein [Diaminobutyricimonas sp. LJ205]
MNNRKKWSSAAAGLLSLALVAGGTSMASAAPGDPVNPQPGFPVHPQPAESAQPGSMGGFFLYDENAERADLDPNRVFKSDEWYMAAASPTDYNAETNPSDIRPVTGSAQFDQVWRFISDRTPAAVAGGLNTWKAYAADSAAGPNGGTAQPDFTLDSFTTGIGDVVAAGGSYWYGIAYTTNAGVTTVGAVYRQINITKGTGDYTISPFMLVQAPAWSPDFTAFTGTSEYKLRNGNIEINAGVGNAGKTVDVWAEGPTVDDRKVLTDVVLDANGEKTIQTAAIADGERVAIAEGETVLSWATAKDYVDVEPTGTDPNNVTVANPTEGSTVVTIPAGLVNANQTFRAVAWSTPTQLGNVTTDANGDVDVDVSALSIGDHTIALYDNGDNIVAWGTFALSSTTKGAATLTAEALTSDKFALEGVNAAANLGATKRGTTTTEVDLGAFTVIDDRDTNLSGWTLTADVEDFVNTPASDTIANSALGIAPKQVGTLPDGVTVTLAPAQVAGKGAGSALFAEGPAGVSTLEAGVQFDAGLTFAVPASAKKGTYTSKLTLTLLQK